MIDIKVEKKEVTVIKGFVEFPDGFRWDLEDLVETLDAIDDGEVVVSAVLLGKTLMNYKVLTSLGSHKWLTGAEKGEEFDEFYKELLKHV